MNNDTNTNQSPARTGAGQRACLTALGIILLAMCGCRSIHGVQGNLTWYQGFGGDTSKTGLKSDMVGIGISFPIGKQ